MKHAFSKALFVLAPLAISALVSCANVFAPSTNTGDADIASTTDVPTLLSMGDSALDANNFSRALTAYSRAVGLSNICGRARLGVARSAMLRDDWAALDILGSLMSGGTNAIMGFGTIAAASTLYATNGAVVTVLNALKPTNGTSWWNGGCDSSVPTNSFTANLLVFYVMALEFPALLFDLRRDFVYNNTNSLTVDGDLLVSTAGSLGLNPSYVAITNDLVTIANDMASGTNLTKPSLLAIDDRISNVHESLMGILASLKSSDPLSRLSLISEATARLQAVPNAGPLTNVLSALFAVGPMMSMVTNDTNVGNFLSGAFFNGVHEGLNGEQVVIPSAGIASFSHSNWVCVSNTSVVAGGAHLQGQLKTIWNALGF